MKNDPVGAASGAMNGELNAQNRTGGAYIAFTGSGPSHGWSVGVSVPFFPFFSLSQEQALLSSGRTRLPASHSWTT